MSTWSSGQGGLLDVIPHLDFAKSRQSLLHLCRAAARGSSLGGVPALRGRHGTDARQPASAVRARARTARAASSARSSPSRPTASRCSSTSGERQALHLGAGPQPGRSARSCTSTLDGKPAPGNPGRAKTGTATVTVTDPSRNTELASQDRAGAHPGGRRHQSTSPPRPGRSATATPMAWCLDASGRLWGERDGPQGRRRSQPDPQGQELRLAAAFPMATITTARRYPRHAPGVTASRAPAAHTEPVHLARRE